MMMPLPLFGLVLASGMTLSDSVTLTLSTDSPTYYVGEVVRLRVVAVNQGEAAVRGFFVSRSHLDTVQISYRRVNRSISRFATIRNNAEEIDTVRSPMVLKPGQEAKSEFVLSFDPTASRFVLDEPGDYEFQVSYRADPADPNGLLVSNVVRVAVSDPPEREREAFRHYSRAGMGLLAQYDPLSSPDIDPRVMQSALELVDRYPSSPYAEAVRKGLLRALQEKLSRNEATGGERAVYDRLRQMRPEDR